MRSGPTRGRRLHLGPLHGEIVTLLKDTPFLVITLPRKGRPRERVIYRLGTDLIYRYDHTEPIEPRSPLTDNK